MPEIDRERMIALALPHVWTFVRDMNTWAIDLPGYQGHRAVSDRESFWRLTGSVGLLSREIELRVVITEWVEATSVSFLLEGVEEPVSGSGSLVIAAETPNTTKLRFHLELAASGAMAPIVNVLLTTQLASTADRFVDSLASHLAKAHVAAST